MIMADKIINVRGYKFELLRWNEKWVFPFVTYYQSGLGSPVCIVLFSWNQEEDIFEQETTVTVNLPHYERGAGCQFVDTNNNGSSMTDWLVKNGFGLPTHRYAESGFCRFPEFYFMSGEKFLIYKNFCDAHPEIAEILFV